MTQKELMTFSFPENFCKSLRYLSSLQNKDMALIVIEAVGEKYIKNPQKIGVRSVE